VERKGRPADSGRCEHRCYPVEAVPVDGGRVAHCLGCCFTGPTSAGAIEALAALRNPGVSEAGNRHLRLVGA
jgi:hypothetical protein